MTPLTVRPWAASAGSRRLLAAPSFRGRLVFLTTDGPAIFLEAHFLAAFRFAPFEAAGFDLSRSTPLETRSMPASVLATAKMGVDSDLVTPETQKRMEKTVPGIEAVKVEGTGHMIPQDVPEKFEELIKGFLKRIKH